LNFVAGIKNPELQITIGADQQVGRPNPVIDIYTKRIVPITDISESGAV